MQETPVVFHPNYIVDLLFDTAIHYTDMNTRFKIFGMHHKWDESGWFRMYFLRWNRCRRQFFASMSQFQILILMYVNAGILDPFNRNWVCSCIYLYENQRSKLWRARERILMAWWLARKMLSESLTLVPFTWTQISNCCVVLWFGKFLLLRNRRKIRITVLYYQVLECKRHVSIQDHYDTKRKTFVHTVREWHW